MTPTLTTKIVRNLALLVTCGLLAACLGQGSPQITYYSLLTMAQMETVPSALPTRSDLQLGIGPLTVPDALKRAQMVTRDAQNRYLFNEFHRWAGTLEDDIALVLGDNLGELLGVNRIGFFPWLPHFAPTHRLVMDIVRFDGNLSAEAILSARWTIVDGSGKRVLASGKSVYRQPVEPGDYTGLALAESRLLAALSEELAGELLKLKND